MVSNNNIMVKIDLSKLSEKEIDKWIWWHSAIYHNLFVVNFFNEELEKREKDGQINQEGQDQDRQDDEHIGQERHSSR